MRSMERRLHPRTQVHFEAKVTNRTTGEQPSMGEICDASEKGISVVLPLPSAPSDIVEIEVADSVLLGRVAYCNPEGSRYRTGLQVEKVHLGNSNLSTLLQRTLQEAMPCLPGVEQEVALS